MAAGIVASTLRRRTFRHKASIDARIQADQAASGGGVLPMQTLSPTAAATSSAGGPPSRSSSFRRSFSGSGRSPGRQARVYAPRGAKLFHEDFWPSCVNANEPNLRLVTFESFE